MSTWLNLFETFKFPIGRAILHWTVFTSRILLSCSLRSGSQKTERTTSPLFNVVIMFLASDMEMIRMSYLVGLPELIIHHYVLSVVHHTASWDNFFCKQSIVYPLWFHFQLRTSWCSLILIVNLLTSHGSHVANMSAGDTYQLWWQGTESLSLCGIPVTD